MSRMVAVIVTGLGLGAAMMMALLVPEHEEVSVGRVVQAGPTPVFSAPAIAPWGSEAPVEASDGETAEAVTAQTRQPLLFSGTSTRRIAGRIVRAADGTPIEEEVIVGFSGPPEAALTTRGRDVTASSFDFPGVPAQATRLTLTRTLGSPGDGGSERSHQSVRLPPGDRDVLDLVIHLDTGATIHGVVVDPDQRPVVGARVLIAGQATTTGGHGAFVLRDILVDRRRAPVAIVRHADFPPHESSITGGGSPTRTRITLAWGGRIAGRIIDGAGRPVPGATIEVAAPRSGQTPPDLMPHAIAAPDGTYRLTGVPVHGRNVLRVGAVDRPIRQLELVAVQAGRTTFLDIELGRGGTLYGQVTDDLGRPVAGVEMVLKTWHRYPPGRMRGCGRSRSISMPKLMLGSVVTGPDGRYLMQGIGGENLSLFVEGRFEGLVAPGRIDVPSVGNGDEVKVDVQLKTGRSLTGFVVDTQGRPIADAYVWTYNRRERHNTTTDEHGRFVLSHLYEGPFITGAEAEGHSGWRQQHTKAGSLQITLERLPLVHLSLSDGETGFPIHTYEVATQSPKGPNRKRVVTLDGCSAVPAQAVDITTLTIQAPGYVSFEGLSMTATHTTNPRPLHIKLWPNSSQPHPAPARPHQQCAM